MENHWKQGPGKEADPLDQIVYLSNSVGQDLRLVQPGGGNSSIKITREGDDKPLLLVKGSGTDLRSIGRGGFTPLSLEALNALKEASSMSDAEMMSFMAECMTERDAPVPSVETPLHSLLPAKVILHTHDIATMSMTNVKTSVGERLVEEVFEGNIAYAPFARPGFPLAKLVAEFIDEVPEDAWGMTLAHHGLVVWGETAAECYERLQKTIDAAEDFIETSRRGSRAPGKPNPRTSDSSQRRDAAVRIMPAIRGALSSTDRVILNFDDDAQLLESIGHDRTPELVARGVATPEHVLRAGKSPIWLDVDPESDVCESEVREGIQNAHSEYAAYHRKHSDEPLIGDWAKVVMVPGVGLVTAFKDKKSARVANLCYRATLEAIENAEAIDGFEFVSEEEVFEFEHWPLERRKVEQAIKKEKETLKLPRRIATVIGGGSGIGAASALELAREGAHVVVADLDMEAAESVAAQIMESHGERAIAIGVDVRDDASIRRLFEETVLTFGGLDCLVLSAGLAPRFADLVSISRDDLRKQMEVHYEGAVLAIKEAADIMIRQGIGGSIIASVSKAAVTPGKSAIAYGGSKAALLQALRVAAVELGPHNIRVNSINADQVETPMFMDFVKARAASKGLSVEEQLEAYKDRNLMGASLIPATVVAEMVTMLASDTFRFTTGDILTVDGGLPEAFPR